MIFNHNEIIEEITAHIGKSGGNAGEWCVGTAKDARGPFFRRHLVADLHDGLLYREAFTTTAADQVIDQLVKNCSLQRAFSHQLSAVSQGFSQAPEAAGQPDAAPEPGKLVFVYRPTEAKCDPAPADAAPVAASLPRHGSVAASLPRHGDVKSPLRHAA
jgi:hypothetical protein